MPFTKGTPKPKNSGRKKGAKNKLTSSAKEAYLFAFDDIGGKKALSRWGRANQDEFYRQFARLVPVDKTISGEVAVTFVEDLKKDKKK